MEASKRMIHMFGEFGRATLEGGVTYDAFCKALDAEALVVTLEHDEPHQDAETEATPSAAPVEGAEAPPKKKKKKKSKKKKIMEKLTDEDEEILVEISNKACRPKPRPRTRFTLSDPSTGV